MTTAKKNDPKLRLNEIQEENGLLLVQLHEVQDELERRVLGSPTSGRASSTLGHWVDDELPEALAENLRLKTALDVQGMIHQHGAQNALNVRLGNVLIKGVESKHGVFTLPNKLLKIWRETNQKTPPAVLGGGSFAKTIATYQEGGLEAVEKLLASVSISPFVHASALTALARSLMHRDPSKAAEFSRSAYAIEPRPFRLKWLAFRLHEAGEVVEAEAILSALSSDIQFSESELRQVGRLRKEAHQARLQDAKQKTAYTERRTSIDQKLEKLVLEREQLTKLVMDRAREIEVFQEQNTLQEREITSLLAKYEEHRILAEVQATKAEKLGQLNQQRLDESQLLFQQLHDVQEELEGYFTQKLQLEQEKIGLVNRHDEQAALAAERAREIEALQATRAQLAEEKSVLAAQHDEQAALAAERAREIGALQATQAQLAEEKSALVARHDEQAALAAERAREIGALQATQAQLAEEKSALAARHDEQAALAAERAREIEALQATRAHLAEEKSALAARHDEQAALAAERAREIEALQAVQAKLAEEKLALAARHDEQVALAAERLKQLNELQQQVQSRQEAENDLRARQQHMQDEIIRAEAQLDLIKDMILRDAGL